jgi:hydroxymethylbilane synthase
MRLVFATRRSALALAQSRAFAARLADLDPSLELEELHVVTAGDRTQDRPLQDIGGKGLFVKELEQAMLDGRADFAVHSMKDVPTEVPEGLAFACVPEREDPRDALVCRAAKGLFDLPRGARVGTGSLRRGLELRRSRPDLVIEPLRGNVDTRLRRLEEGAFDAIVLALAGMKRLGLAHRATEVLAPSVCLPAIGQGALGIECRASDERLVSLLERLEHRPTKLCVSAERAVLAAVEGNCKTPVAAYATLSGSTLSLRALLAEPDGSRFRQEERSMTLTDDGDATSLGRAVGLALLAS